METIKKLPSGFYALFNGEKMIDPSLIVWDGKRYKSTDGNWYEFPEEVDKCRDFETWYQDTSGTIWIQYNDGTFCYMYSPGCVLYKHLCNMRKLARRYTKC